MASSLDLQEQEQLDALKAFWAKYGNLVTLTLTLAFLVVAGINGWTWWQRKQAEGAAALYDQLERSAQAGDAARSEAIFADIKDKYGRTAYAANAGLLAAKVQVDKGQGDAALKSLEWVGANASEPEVKAMAHLHAAGVLMDKKDYNGALAQVDAAGKFEGTMGALVADRRGDVLALLGRMDEARTAYQSALKTMDAKLDYRVLLEAKLAAIGGGAPAAATAAAAGASK